MVEFLSRDAARQPFGSSTPAKAARSEQKDQGATGGNPYNGPLAARNRNRFRFQYPTVYSQRQLG